MEVKSLLDICTKACRSQFKGEFDKSLVPTDLIDRLTGDMSRVNIVIIAIIQEYFADPTKYLRTDYIVISVLRAGADNSAMVYKEYERIRGLCKSTPLALYATATDIFIDSKIDSCVNVGALHIPTALLIPKNIRLLKLEDTGVSIFCWRDITNNVPVNMYHDSNGAIFPLCQYPGNCMPIRSVSDINEPCLYVCMPTHIIAPNLIYVDKNK